MVHLRTKLTCVIVEAVSAKANLRQQVKPQPKPKQTKRSKFDELQANLRQQVKRSGRSQNRRLQKVLPA